MEQYNIPYSIHLKHDMTTGMHWSQGLQIYFVLAGSLQIRCGSRTREYQEHDYFFCLPDTAWSLVSQHQETHVLEIFVHRSFLLKYCPDLKSLTLSRHHLTADLSNRTYCRVCKDLANMIFNNLKKDTCADLKVLGAATDLLTALIEAYGIFNDSDHPESYVTQRNIQILQFIQDHYKERIKIADVASSVGLHPQYFSSYFKAQFSMGFVDYLTQLRVSASTGDLSMTDHSILEIALDHGFANHKTYAAAFRKIVGCTPGEYRKVSNRPSSGREYGMQDKPDSRRGIYAFFSQFTEQDHAVSDPSLVSERRSLEFTPSAMVRNAFSSGRAVGMSSGRAYACLRSNLQMQIRQAKKDLNLTYLRFRDIFSDSLYVYNEDENKHPVYSWQNLDDVFDLLVSLQIIPLIEIGFMPEKLASKKQYAGFQYRPNVSQPKSLSRWQDLIRCFLLHFLDRYGQSEIHKWLFDFWISPDLELKYPYWYGSMEEFFRFYKATWDVFQETDPLLQLGSANFSIISGLPWYDAFFAFCTQHGIRPAFVSSQLYGSNPIQTPETPDYLETIDSKRFSVSDPDYLSRCCGIIKSCMDRHGFSDVPFIINDWSLTFLPRDYIRETCYMGPWICYNYIQTLGTVSQMSFWCLSDIHEEAFPESRMFYGGPGAMDYHGFRKASYNTFFLLSQLGDTILEKGSYYLLAKKKDVWQCLIFQLVPFDEMFSSIDNTVIDRTHRYNIYQTENNMLVSLLLHLEKGTYLIRKWEVNRSAGSAYDIWAQIGFPEKPGEGVLEYIEKSSHPRLTCFVRPVEDTLLLEESIPPHGVLLLEIEKQPE